MNLSRKVLILEAKNDGIIEFNYYYKIMQEIYQVVTKIDKDKGFRLHQDGYRIDNKMFKLFNFGISCNESETNNDGFIIRTGDKIKLTVSGVVGTLNTILKAVMKNGFELYDVKLDLLNINDDEKVRFNKIMLYRTQTPVVESIYNAEENKREYLSVYQNRFYNALAQNLFRKYQLVYGKKYDGELYFDIENVIKAKQRYIQGIKGKGFLVGYNNFEIFIEAREDMQKIAYYLGIGQNNSIGMGMLKFITGRRCA